MELELISFIKDLNTELLNEDGHPERGNLFPSRMGIAIVRLDIDD